MHKAMGHSVKKLRVAIINDYQDVVRTLDCFSKLEGHDVTIWTDIVGDIDVLADRLADADVLVLMRERTKIDENLLSRLPNLKLISQNGHIPHIDLAACDRHGVVVSSALTARPSYSTVEFTWGLILAAMRNIPFESASLRQGHWGPSPPPLNSFRHLKRVARAKNPGANPCGYKRRPPRPPNRSAQGTSRKTS